MAGIQLRPRLGAAGEVSAHPLETYLSDCYSVRATGANALETSFYPVFSTLFNEVGRHQNAGTKADIRASARTAEKLRQ